MAGNFSSKWQATFARTCKPTLVSKLLSSTEVDVHELQYNKPICNAKCIEIDFSLRLKGIELLKNLICVQIGHDKNTCVILFLKKRLDLLKFISSSHFTPWIVRPLLP